MNWYLYTLVLIGAVALMTSPIWVLAALKRYDRRKENRKGQGMAKKRETWDIEIRHRA